MPFQFTPLPGDWRTRTPHIEVTCDHCGLVFWRKRSKNRGSYTFCGRPCQYAHFRKYPPVACEICGQIFTNRPHARFCSQPCAIQARTAPLSERFWARVDKNGPIPPHQPELGPCWVWTGTTNFGYGQIWSLEHRRIIKAHRASWVMHVGPIPDGLYVCHHCDNPPCVRPDHLFLGNDADNMHDMMAKGRKVTPPKPRGMAHYRAKLTDDDVREIRRKAAAGQSHLSLARERGMSQKTIVALIRRQTWKHVADDHD